MNTTPNDESVSLKRRGQVVWRLLVTAARLRPWAFAGFFCGAVIEIAGSIGSIYATAKLGALVAGFVTTGETAGIWFWLWVDIAALTSIGLGFLAMDFFKRIIFFSFVRWSTNTFLAAMCRLDLPSFYDPKMRNELNRVSGAYIWQVPSLLQSSLDLGYGILRFAAITVVVAQIVWWIVPLIAIFLVPSLLGEARLAKMQWFVWDSKGDFRHVFWGLESIVRQAKGQMELRSSQAVNFVLGKISSMNRAFYREQEHKYRHASRLIVPTKILEVAGTAIGSIVLLKQFLGHSISLERYFFLSGALFRVGSALNAIFGTLSYMQENMLFAHSYFKVVEAEAKISDPPSAKPVERNTAPKIVFENVSFVYPGQDKPVFDNLSFTINSGEHVALVGENGAGKTTLIKLLLRFYQPTSGRILINGQDLQTIAIDSWYDQLATLFQEFNRYPLSIAENIEIGRAGEQANQKKMHSAAKFGDVDDIVKSYEHGWDTVLDASFAKGVEPSGGQWQRVALARAFYRRAQMIILDEPTSAIDAKAEYDIFNNIFDHYKNKTALIISHRFSTVRRAKTIIVLEHGKIIEQGSHSELMQQHGSYYELFTKQAEGYR